MAARHTRHPLDLVVEETQDSPGDDQALQLEQSPTQDDRFEATELARLRSNYSRVSQQSGPTIAVMKPATLLGRLTYNVKKFWKNQVSIAVDHEACRDHLGMCSIIFILVIMSSGYFQSRLNSGGIPPRFPLLALCAMSYGTFSSYFTKPYIQSQVG